MPRLFRYCFPWTFALAETKETNRELLYDMLNTEMPFDVLSGGFSEMDTRFN